MMWLRLLQRKAPNATQGMSAHWSLQQAMAMLACGERISLVQHIFVDILLFGDTFNLIVAILVVLSLNSLTPSPLCCDCCVDHCNRELLSWQNMPSSQACSSDILASHHPYADTTDFSHFQRGPGSEVRHRTRMSRRGSGYFSRQIACQTTGQIERLSIIWSLFTQLLDTFDGFVTPFSILLCAWVWASKHKHVYSTIIHNL